MQRPDMRLVLNRAVNTALESLRKNRYVSYKGIPSLMPAACSAGMVRADPGMQMQQQQGHETTDLLGRIRQDSRKAGMLAQHGKAALQQRNLNTPISFSQLPQLPSNAVAARMTHISQGHARSASADTLAHSRQSSSENGGLPTQRAGSWAPERARPGPKSTALSSNSGTISPCSTATGLAGSAAAGVVQLQAFVAGGEGAEWSATEMGRAIFDSRLSPELGRSMFDRSAGTLPFCCLPSCLLSCTPAYFVHSECCHKTEQSISYWCIPPMSLCLAPAG